MKNCSSTLSFASIALFLILTSCSETPPGDSGGVAPDPAAEPSSVFDGPKTDQGEVAKEESVSLTHLDIVARLSSQRAKARKQIERAKVEFARGQLREEELDQICALYDERSDGINFAIDTLRAALVQRSDYDELRNHLPIDESDFSDYTDRVESIILPKQDLDGAASDPKLSEAGTETVHVESARVGADTIVDLVSLGVAVYEIYRSAKDEERRLIFDQLETLKWKTFYEIPPFVFSSTRLTGE